MKLKNLPSASPLLARVAAAGEVRSKTKWDGDRVAAQSKLSRPGRDGAAGPELDVTQRWQVSSDGRSLTNSTVTGSARTGVQEIRPVYRRAP